MPRLSKWMLRAALVYLALGFTLGALLLANKGIPFLPILWRLLPVHVEVVLFGWLVQFALGVGFWILPRYPGGSRGNETLAWISCGLLNLGILLAILPALDDAAGPWLVAGRAAEFGAVALFIAHAWGRVRGFGAQPTSRDGRR